MKELIAALEAERDKLVDRAIEFDRFIELLKNGGATETASIPSPLIQRARPRPAAGDDPAYTTDEANQDLILAYLDQHGTATNEQIGRHFRLSTSWASRLTRQMRARGTIEVRGKQGMSNRYGVVVKEGRE